jgi:hypothetical protein
VRDADGRTYVATTVTLPALSLSALQLAVAMAASSGALKLEAAAIVGEAPTRDDAGRAALDALAPGALLMLADAAGAPLN